MFADFPFCQPVEQTTTTSGPTNAVQTHSGNIGSWNINTNGAPQSGGGPSPVTDQAHSTALALLTEPAGQQHKREADNEAAPSSGSGGDMSDSQVMAPPAKSLKAAPNASAAQSSSPLKEDVS